MSGPRKRRKQRQAKWLEQQVDEALEGPVEASEGQFYVINMETGEKTPGLNLKQTKELWASLSNAIYLSMDSYKRGNAPLKANFDAGQLP